MKIANLAKFAATWVEKGPKAVSFFVSFSWFCFLFCFLSCFVFFFFFGQRAIWRRREKSNGHTLSFYIALEILFWPKKKRSERRGIFRGNVFKTPARYRNVKPEPVFLLFYPCIIIIIIIITLSFQASFCVGILRSRCFPQPSIWMKMLISNNLLHQEKWAHKAVVAEECGTYHCCTHAGYKKLTNCCFILLLNWISLLLFSHRHVSCKILL